MRPDEEQYESAGELIKFMILVAILLLIVLIVAAGRPFIFERLVPAALGWDTPEPGSAPTLVVPTPLLPAIATPPTASDVDPAATEEGMAPAPTVTPLPTATPQSYQVQAGDNLTRIARQFGISVEALAAANSLTNPDRLRPGDVLIIPAP